ncbi:hypothetical protein EON82_16390 [bacterium]|nr:MAG: hypothetical protein EON82_16390 [bacterium]
MATVTFGAGISGARGKFGTAVFQQYGETTMMRPLVTPHDPRTPAQVSSRLRMSAAAEFWKALSDAELAAWEAFAATQTGGAYRIFGGLIAKWLQMNPTETPPTMPPLGPFYGDAPTLGIVASSESGVLTVAASQPNAAGVVTEILVQTLAHKRRKPRKNDWRTATFLNFDASSLTQSLPLEPGAYAVAYRFVKATTGQASVMTTIGSLAVD